MRKLAFVYLMLAALVAVLLVAACQVTVRSPFAQPGASATAAAGPTSAVPSTPEAQALVSRAQAIEAVDDELRPRACSLGQQAACQALLSARGVVDQAMVRLQTGPGDATERTKAAGETLAQGEQALIGAMKLAGRPLNMTECQGAHAPAFQDACGAVDRVRALTQVEDEAMRLDGTPDASRVRQQSALCTGDKQTCLAAAKALEAQSRTGSLAGQADVLTREIAAQVSGWSHGVGMNGPLVVPSVADVGLAEEIAKQATAAAQQVAGVRAAAAAERQGRTKLEQGLLYAAETDCKASHGDYCDKKCTGGDGSYCVAVGSRLWHARPPRFSDATAAMKRACDLGTLTGCDLVGQVDADAQADAAAAREAWRGVQEIGDDIATKNYQADFALRVSPTARNAAAIGRLRQAVAASVRDQYCPAKKAFLSARSAGEFVKFAAYHCSNSPPEFNGTALAAQCRAAYAASCP